MREERTRNTRNKRKSRKSLSFFAIFAYFACFAFSPAQWLRGWDAASELSSQGERYGVDLWREAEGLSQSRIRAIVQTRDGYIWLGTDNGVVRFNGTSFTAFTVETGSLKENEVCTLIEDNEGGLWIRVSKAELRAFVEGGIRKVTSYDYGVRVGNPGNQPTAWKAADGALLFCTLQGLVIADPRRLAVSGAAPPVYVEQVIINKQPQPIVGEPEAPVGAGEVEIHFAALSYLAPERMRYKYRLAGFDQEWVDVGTRRFADYANLSPGWYRFQVRAGNPDGPWNEAGASFAFYLQPRFYQTRLFLVIVALAVMLAAGLLYRLRMHGLKARYSAVLAERNRIAGEIHDTLAQNLAGIALQLDSVTMQLADAPAGLRERLDQACNLTRYSLSEARRAISTR